MHIGRLNHRNPSVGPGVERRLRRIEGPWAVLHMRVEPVPVFSEGAIA